MRPDVLKAHPGVVLSPKADLRQAMSALTRTGVGIALVVGAGRRLLGVVTDIDIRRALLRGEPMSLPAARVMTRRPLTAPAAASEEEVAALFRRTSKAYLPVVEGRGRLVRLAALLDYALARPEHPNWVIVMAGGAGKRLRPLTESIPKPMVRVGDKPILELLLEQLTAAGFRHFIFSVNYLAKQIRSHFGDGRRWQARIEYLQEPRPLGTVGALSLLKRRFQAPLLVVNGDILTKVNFPALLSFHRAEKALATLCVKDYEVQVPYGVVHLKGGRLDRIAEKPTCRFKVSAGIYILEPKTLSWLVRGKACDMPDFIAAVRRRRKDGIACFPIQEYWTDIGDLKDYERASGEYAGVFKA